MRIHITARHTKLTEALTGYLEKKVVRLERYFDHLVWANAILSVEKHWQMTELIIHSPLHTIRAKAESRYLYSSIDLAVDKAERQLKKLKAIWKDKRVRRARVEHAATHVYGAPQPRLSPVDGPQEEAYGAVGGWPPAITVVKKVPVKPISVEQAIQTMESMGYNFWMFFNKTSKKIHVIFRRSDQSYGILEPSKNG